MTNQSGATDSRASVSADVLRLNGGGYPFFAEGAAGTCTIDIAEAIGGAADDPLSRDVEFGHLTYSASDDPEAGAALQVLVDGDAVFYHYIAYKGERSMPIGFRFLAGQVGKVRIVDAGAAVGVTLCLHNPR